ncbi:hypothetical protein NB696_003940 [Xanthomonas sacchari]|nr:hypothetical protein [Xanthomonas sacchari]MCW0447068.1 hypothetical protein [Xanthomonas sacchari]MCW0464406.1 hypothetical protein [Xanthomonas sacchari]
MAVCVDPGHRTDRQDGVAAQREETVADADTRIAQQFAQHRAHQLLRGGRGRHVPILRQVGFRRKRQRSRIDLAVRRQRQRHQGNIGQRDHVVRQTVFEELANACAAVNLAIDIARQLVIDGNADAAAVRVFPCACVRGSDIGILGERGFDFAQFDPEATDFDLVVTPADVFQIARRQPAHQIPSAVPTLWRRSVDAEHHEPFHGERRSVVVAAGQADARDVQFAQNAHRHSLALVVENGAAVVGQRTPHVHAILAGVDAERRAHRGLGRTIGVVEGASVHPAAGIGAADRLSADQQVGQSV